MRWRVPTPLVILTEWNEFRGLDLERAQRGDARARCIIDLRNIFDPAQVARRRLRLHEHRPAERDAARPSREPRRGIGACPARPTASTRRCCASTTFAASSASTLHAADARAIGRAFGTMVLAAGGRQVRASGCDGRLSSPELAAATGAGLVGGRARGAVDRPGADADDVLRRAPPRGRRRASRSPARTTRPTTTASR